MVIRRSNGVRRWSGGGEGLKWWSEGGEGLLWWSGGATTGGLEELKASSSGHAEVRASGDVLVEHRVLSGGLAEVWASGGGPAEVCASGGVLVEHKASSDDSVEVRALGGGLVKHRASSGGPVEVWASGGGPAESEPQVVVRQKSGPHMVAWRRRGPPVVIRRSNDVRRWSGGGEGLKWWFGGATTSGDGPTEIEATVMPSDYRYKVWILCNDCNGMSEVFFHIIGHKCSGCQSYNTRTGLDLDPLQSPLKMEDYMNCNTIDEVQISQFGHRALHDINIVVIGHSPCHLLLHEGSLDSEFLLKIDDSLHIFLVPSLPLVEFAIFEVGHYVHSLIMEFELSRY
ncbi:hypothetical protein KFK09_006074 [Dendrobium nobile]|uniref:RCHY1 zinc-ribbon domain-containing protein n=1 Tax=Dendrobium nobile TaxID=94219 RepID=A0A8T3BNQ0_DENNO|nr:hypothetical protein KFK09_006074 [Dendrobium nobile]